MRKLLAIACLAALLPGCAGPGQDLPAEWRGRNLDEPGWESVTIPANWSYGVEYYLPAGRTLAWDWVAFTNGSLYFQLALNGQSAPLRSGHGNEGKGTYTTRLTGVYVLSWGLDGLPDTRLFHKLPEGGLPQQWPPGEGPDCPPFGFKAC